MGQSEKIILGNIKDEFPENMSDFSWSLRDVYEPEMEESDNSEDDGDNQPQKRFGRRFKRRYYERESLDLV